jgi:hypothetical protein
MEDVDLKNGCFTPDQSLGFIAAFGVRREKAAAFQWVKVPPGKAGSNRSNYGGDEIVEAFGYACHELVIARVVQGSYG